MTWPARSHGLEQQERTPSDEQYCRFCHPCARHMPALIQRRHILHWAFFSVRDESYKQSNTICILQRCRHFSCHFQWNLKYCPERVRERMQHFYFFPPPIHQGFFLNNLDSSKFLNVFCIFTSFSTCVTILFLHVQFAAQLDWSHAVFVKDVSHLTYCWRDLAMLPLWRHGPGFHKIVAWQPRVDPWTSPINNSSVRRQAPASFG